MGRRPRQGRFEPLVGDRAGIVRERLLEQVRQRFTTPVVVVSAPAGFGKTMLLAQAVAENRRAPIGVDHWLTCQPDDAAPSSLAAGLCDALGAAVPSPARGRVDDAVEAAVEAVTEAIWHRSPEQVSLLIDDLHEIPTDSAGADLLEQLRLELPRNGHLVLAGRGELPVTSARADIQGRLLRLDQDDLLFTDEELAAFAALRGVPAEQLAASGRWPALAELAVSAPSARLAQTAYLWEEVLAHLDPERRRVLALLAFVGPLDDTLAAAILGHDVDLAVLTASMPLVGRTANGAWVVHPLWRPQLAGVVDSQHLADARRRAGLTLAGIGDAARAVQLLAEAEAWDDLVRVVTGALGAAHPPVPADVVAGWLCHLPAGMQSHPLARLVRAVAEVQRGPEAASRRLTEAMNGFRREGDLAGELACIAQLAQLAWWWERPEQMVGVAARVIELEAAGHAPAVPLACLGRALVADVANDCATALAELDRIPPGSLNQSWQSLVDWLRSTSLNHLGRPAEALVAAERAGAHPAPSHAPLIATGRLQALWFHGRVDEVLRELPALVDRTAAIGLHNYTALVAATACTAFAYAGRYEAAAPYLERARASVVSVDLPLVEVNLAIAQAALHVARGDEAAAARVLADYVQRARLLGVGHAAAPQQRVLALWYVLVPTTRSTWDEATLGPSFTLARDLARAVVAIREGRPVATTRLPTASDHPDLVRAHLPLRWATELALAEIERRHEAGWALLDRVWPAARTEVRHHAEGTGPLRRPARAALARLPVPPGGRLELRVLGPVELRRDGQPVDQPEWGRERVRSLLAYLVLHRHVTRERLGGDLWPSLDAEAQSRNLRVTLSYLLRVLEPDRSEHDASFVIRPHGGTLELRSGKHFAADVWTFDELCRVATETDQQGAPSAALAAIQQAVALWRDDPSELASEPWALTEIEERRARLVRLAARAGQLLLAKGESDQACQMAEVALRVDPWSETSHRVAVGALVALGDEPGARRALARYRGALDELGLSPDDVADQTSNLARQLHLDCD